MITNVALQNARWTETTNFLFAHATTNWFCSFIRNAADSEINEANLIVKIKSRMHEMAFYFSGKGSDLCGKLPVIFLSTIQSHTLPMFISLFCGCNKLINLLQIDNYKKLIHLWINLSWWNIHTKLIIRSMITLEWYYVLLSHHYVLHRMDTFEEVSQKIYEYSSLSISSIILSADSSMCKYNYYIFCYNHYNTHNITDNSKLNLIYEDL